MGVLFNKEDLLKVAMEIEKNGGAFYRKQAGLTKNQDIEFTFNWLASQEDEHLKTFTGLLHTVELKPSKGAVTDDYMSYLTALAQSYVFSKDMVEASHVEMADKPSKALRFALDMERDSILFYHELKEVVRDQDQAILEKIINEERTHVKKLRELMEKF